ncbi:lactate dehydrogenase [Ventosimonas gracilis]|uniref:Lactate dehydrogenase n=1 Tax=Ventosimonas gracilis TaxID=1680762 RepID=A0A139SXH0_9GAMM|nr:Ldh family oxidoreductase [Ventosimonas gracilis]KXU39318.1 lactate dehydrogenase [Ventosimonas gracilis]
MRESGDAVRLSFNELKDLLRRVFIKVSVNQETAELLADNCAMVERDGPESHGVFRIEGYLNTLKSGWVNGCADPRIEDCGESFIRVDADNGFAQLCLARARPLLLEKVRRSGCAVLMVRGSHHFSALWPDIEPFAQQGLLALTFVAGLSVVAVSGGKTPVFGTNPLAFACPVAGSSPLVFDFATSALSNGDTRIAARAGHLLPDGCGIDKSGQPTNNPEQILNGGALLPFGGHKGAAIILMVEILAAALTGGAFSYQVDFKNHPGAETPKTGQLLIVIDPARGGNHDFAARVAALLNLIRASGENIRIAGDKRLQNRARAEQQGIVITRAVLAQLNGFL